jgi:hypothetical protein|tara:strand:- start:6091 stop:6672 length:582 start_codon:yes stop_codon:yes gene_type:complete
MPANPLNFTIEGRMKTIADIQRNWMWQMLIPGIIGVAPSALLDMEDLLIRCRSISSPPRANTVTQSDWMGMKQFFPGKPDVGGTVAATFEETEDMAVRRIFWDWEQNIFNINPKSSLTAGKSRLPNKRTMTRDIFLVYYGYNGVPLPKMIRFHNAFPQSVGDVPLDYGAGAAVQYTVTFQYDFWTLHPETTQP